MTHRPDASRRAGKIGVLGSTAAGTRLNSTRAIRVAADARGLIAIAASMALISCAGQTVIGQRYESPYDPLVLSVVARGAPGSAFAERNEKHVFVRIFVEDGNSTRYLMQKEYGIVASNLVWRARWISPSEARVDFAELPEGVSERQFRQDESKGVPVRSLKFTRVANAAFDQQ
jgi:hypothetical protein